MTLKDAQHLEMTGTFPPGWKKHTWSGEDLNPIIDIWYKQGVAGLPRGLVAQSALAHLSEMARKVKEGGPIEKPAKEKSCDNYFC